MKTYVLHQSQLQDYLRCPELFRRKYTGELEDGPTDSTAIGTALHAYAERRICGTDTGDAVDAAIGVWHEESAHPLFRMVKVKTADTAIKHILRTCGLWEMDVLPHLGDPVYVERHFKLLLDSTDRGGDWLREPALDTDDIEIILEGTIDFGDYGITDWKTYSDGRKYTAGYGGEGWKLQRWGIQPTVYCWAAEQLGHLDDPLKFDFVAIPKTQGDVLWLPCTRGEEDFAWLKRLCWNVVKMLEADLDEWPLNDQSALCSPKWCPAWDTCKGAVLDNHQLSGTLSA